MVVPELSQDAEVSVITRLSRVVLSPVRSATSRQYPLKDANSRRLFLGLNVGKPVINQ